MTCGSSDYVILKRLPKKSITFTSILTYHVYHYDLLDVGWHVSVTVNITSSLSSRFLRDDVSTRETTVPVCVHLPDWTQPVSSTLPSTTFMMLVLVESSNESNSVYFAEYWRSFLNAMCFSLMLNILRKIVIFVI
jgi:hypothetical protein